MEQNDITISARDVAMRFRLTDDKILSLKEFVTRKVRGKIKTNEFWALKGVSFDVHKGEVLGIIGRNGSGKSTLLKCISGILKPTRGNVTCHGNIVPMLELGSGFDPDLTGRENVFLNGAKFNKFDFNICRCFAGTCEIQRGQSGRFCRNQCRVNIQSRVPGNNIEL